MREPDNSPSTPVAQPVPSPSAAGERTLAYPPAAVAPQTLGPGVEFGRYKVEKLLGRGGMGVVYLAHDSQLGRPVALKVPHLAGMEDVEVTARLLREAKAAAILSHPNICRVYDAGVDAGTYFIAMEFIEGRPLSDFIAPSHLQDERRIVIVVRKLALALAEAHAKGIIHRDLKPGNVLINARGEPILTDFGLARLSDQMHDGVSTETGMLVGSPAYMSPEQARGEPDGVGRSSDIYSLGVVLFEMLTGRRPFQGSLLSVLAQIAAEEAPSPASLRPGLDPRLDAICRRMMSKRPQDRHASMTEVAQELTTWLKSAPAIAPAAPFSATQQATKPADNAQDDAAVQSLQLLPEGIVAAKVAIPAPPDGPSASEIAQLKRRVEKLLKDQDFAAALRLLTKLADLSGTISKDLAMWARSQLAGTKEKQRELRDRMAVACNKARAALDKYSYSEALAFLEDFPEEVRSDEAREVFSRAADSLEEYLGLQEQIERALKRRNANVLVPLVQRYLKLKPDNLKMERLAEHLEHNSVARAIANYKGDGNYYDVAGRLVEPKQLVGAGFGVAMLFAIALAVGYIVFVPSSGGNVNTPRPVVTTGGGNPPKSGDGLSQENQKTSPSELTRKDAPASKPDDLPEFSTAPEDARMDHSIFLHGVCLFIGSSKWVAPAPPLLSPEVEQQINSMASVSGAPASIKWAAGVRCMPKLGCQPILNDANVYWDEVSLPFRLASASETDLFTGRVKIKPSNVIELTYAGEYYTQCAKIDDKLRGWAFCCRGIVLQELGEVEQAKKDFASAISIGINPGPPIAAAFINLAAILDQERHYGDAKLYFDQAFLLQPNSPILRYNLAHFKQLNGDRRGEVLTAYKEALVFDKDDSLSLNNRALIYFESGQRDAAQAQADLDSAIKSDPDFVFVVAHLNKAAIFESSGRKDEADAIYAEVIRHDQAIRYRDYAHFRRERLARDAQKYYELVLHEDPFEHYARYRLVDILRLQDKPHSSEKEYQKMPPEAYGSACLRHVDFLRMLHDRGKAIQALKRAGVQEPGNVKLKNALSALEQVIE